VVAVVLSRMEALPGYSAFATAKSGFPVAVDVVDADEPRVVASREGDLGGESEGGRVGGGVEQDGDVVAVLVSHS
jgi:hypothetical protein